jgi:flavin reductase (DIM6/NTAB) family NADH-FMN oxidoreductase RutF
MSSEELPDWDRAAQFRLTKNPAPEWQFGDGANDHRKPEDDDKTHVLINPYAEGRRLGSNYMLLVSAITPRPIALLSTRSKDGKALNLAPFSYFNVLSHDPPIFVIGFASNLEAPEDSLRNLLETKQCVINTVSAGFVEAANATAIDAPYEASEWNISGLTPVFDTETVKPPRVKESIFSVEATLDMVKEFESRAVPGKKTNTMVVLEGSRFWAREDALDDSQTELKPSVGQSTCFLQILRPNFMPRLWLTASSTVLGA